MDRNYFREERRNVEVYDSEGNVIAGFWQYGTLRWDEFIRYITSFTETTTAWAIFWYDLEHNQHGKTCAPGPEIVEPGHYILLSETGDPICVTLSSTSPRPRNSTHTNTPSREPSYHIRGRQRDGKCIITGKTSQTYSRLHVAHIFPRAHNEEWTLKGYPSRITDTADESVMGGETKIDSVQNVITIRSDLHHAWDNYEFGVDPHNDYRITSFVNGNDDINGRSLMLDHIQDPTLRPLDDLFIDHFMQGLLKHMKGSGEEGWSYEDYEDAFGEGSSLSNPKVWGNAEGKERFELLLVDKLFEHRAEIGCG